MGNLKKKLDDLLSIFGFRRQKEGLKTLLFSSCILKEKYRKLGLRVGYYIKNLHGFRFYCVRVNVYFASLNFCRNSLGKRRSTTNVHIFNKLNVP